jgi:alpha-ketoglutarate-dependent 2,4-dichlorophenoxyacetate dioxygenase
MTMQTIHLHPDFGAEIRGVDLLDVVSRDDAYRAVRDAFERFSLLVWRGQQVTDDVQAAVSRAFGPLEVTKVGSLGEGTVYGRITNIGPDGEPVPSDHRQALVGKANALWHTDSSFKQIPAFASMLSARILPSEGGATEFVSTRAAWARLDASEQAALQDRVAEHSYLYSRDRIDPDLVTPAERAALPPVRRRLTWRNPCNGLRALYIASHAGAIEGMPKAEGAALLQRLTDAATQPQHIYAHRWRPGDVAMWDNRATMHRGRPFPSGERRSMVRTTISATVAEGLDEVRVG